MTEAIYEHIGREYRSTRHADPRISQAIRQALGDAESIVNIGAGAGSYEPADLTVVPVEPSTTMIQQRPTSLARAVPGSAEALPLPSSSVDAALAVLTVHHWSDRPLPTARLRGGFPLFAEGIQERGATGLQLLLQTQGAITIATRPGLTSIFVAALAPVVSVLHPRQIKVFLPIRPFLLERSGAIADFDPASGLVGAEPRFIHIAQVFAFGNRPMPERFILDGLEQIGFLTGLYAGSNQITHRAIVD